MEKEKKIHNYFDENTDTLKLLKISNKLFYGNENIIPDYYKNDKENYSYQIKQFKLLLILIEAKLNNCENIGTIIKYYFNAEENKIIFSKNDSEQRIKKVIENLQAIDLLGIYGISEKVLTEYEKIILGLDDKKISYLHKLGILYRSAKIRFELLRLFQTKTMKSFYKCHACGENKYPNILLHCGHVFCKNCLCFHCIASKLKVSKGKVLIKCPIKECPYFIYQEKIREALSGLPNFRIDKDIYKTNCQICDSKDKNQIKELKCEHEVYLCTKCVKLYIDGKEEKCWCGYCMEPIFRGVKKLCVSCNIPQEKNIISMNCGCNYCFACIMKKDIWIKQKNCINCGKLFNENDVKEITKNIEKLGSYGRKLSLCYPNKKPCPYCFTINEVEQGSSGDYFVCKNDTCKKLACKICAAKEELINNHGKSYHRKECSLYRSDDIKECPKCKKNDPCKRPQSLQNNDIPDSEKC